MVQKRNAYRVLVAALLERIRCSWEDNIRMDLRGRDRMGGCGLD